MRAVIKGVCAYVCARVSVIDEQQRALQIYDSMSDRTTDLPLFQQRTFHSQLPTDSERAKEKREEEAGRKKKETDWSGVLLKLTGHKEVIQGQRCTCLHTLHRNTRSHSKTSHGQEWPVIASLCFHARMGALSSTLCVLNHK